MQQPLHEVIDRIQKMEAIFDTLQEPSFRDDPQFPAYLQTLLAYYDSPQWLHDYFLDEQGDLPKELKRGVLSEDGVYNFLAEITPEAE